MRYICRISFIKSSNKRLFKVKSLNRRESKDPRMLPFLKVKGWIKARMPNTRKSRNQTIPKIFQMLKQKLWQRILCQTVGTLEIPCFF